MPNRKLNLFAADIRFMVGTGPDGFFPVAVYARRARNPLTSDLKAGDDSWDMLGTNLSLKQADGSFTTQPERLLLVDSRDFNRLGFGMDDLIESYLQTVMSIVAIDEMSKTLIHAKGKFRKKLFRSTLIAASMRRSHLDNLGLAKTTKQRSARKYSIYQTY